MKRTSCLFALALLLCGCKILFPAATRPLSKVEWDEDVSYGARWDGQAVFEPIPWAVGINQEVGGSRSVGSGAVIHSCKVHGTYVLTAYHCVDGAGDISIWIYDWANKLSDSGLISQKDELRCYKAELVFPVFPASKDAIKGAGQKRRKHREPTQLFEEMEKRKLVLVKLRNSSQRAATCFREIRKQIHESAKIRTDLDKPIATFDKLVTLIDSLILKIQLLKNLDLNRAETRTELDKSINKIDKTIAKMNRAVYKWKHDFAIVKVQSEGEFPVARLYKGTKGQLPEQTPVELVALYPERYPHRHPFTWTEKWTEEVFQHGHSGGPLLWDGKVFAVIASAIQGTLHLAPGGRPTLPEMRKTWTEGGFGFLLSTDCDSAAAAKAKGHSKVSSR